MFYLGTWEIGDLTPKDIKDTILFSYKLGIKSYDTAMVYGNGKVETLLGQLSRQDLKVITKIPAKYKPGLTENINILDIYPYDYVDKCIDQSLKRLNTSKIHAILLHNWSYAWETDYVDQAEKLINHIRGLNVADLIGISLPNGYDSPTLLQSSILNHIDILECPYNSNNIFIEKNLENLKHKTKELVLRSFLKEEDPDKFDQILTEKVKFCIKNGLSFTIGTVNKEHLKANLKLINQISSL